MNQAPNILFLQVDQLAALSLRAYGDEICVSPNLDRLANNGVVFENAYCSFPLCSPSRFSMAAGQLCSTIGAYDNAAEMPASIPTYAHHLRARGYKTALAGKMHFIGPDQHHGFEKRLTADIYPADFSWVPHWGNEGKRDTNDPRVVQVAGYCERTVQMDFDEEVTHRAVQHLYDLARTKDDRPFFLQISFTHPHDPYLCGKEFWDLYEESDIPLPTVPALKEEEHDRHSVRLLKDWGLLGHKFSDTDIRRARHGYYGSISYLDSLIGQVLDTLMKTGFTDRTVIVFTSDHGEMMGERGLWMKKHFFERSIRVPLIIGGAGVSPARRSNLVSLCDLLPTFNGMADGKPWTNEAEPMEGLDLSALFDRDVTEAEASRAVHAEYLAEATEAPIFMVRRGPYKYIWSSTDPALLFNVETDPNELRNLAELSEFESIAEDFERYVARKWDASRLAADIRVSQSRRQLILRANEYGIAPRWNHDEAPGQDVLWYRGDTSYNEWAFAHLKALERV
jgi:choline-sulfatase